MELSHLLTLPWRIVGKERTLSEDMEKHLDGIVHQVNNADYGRIDYMQVLENNIRVYEDKYYDVSKYRDILEDLE